ncbi:hypothetical protein RF55_10686 [Lasius niger]|uniref:Uncharacterized protein n=1 Tax=Lasius niger TaxID=67767 RepID=A0A0J7KGW2_LASNI|nr:hypothetical protein RF55_10686 [Lasius niger]
MERKREGAERKKKGERREEKAGGSEGEREESEVACDKIDGKKVGGGARKNKTEEGKDGGERKEGTREEGVMEGLRKERRNGGKDVKDGGTEGRREVWRGEGEGMRWEVRKRMLERKVALRGVEERMGDDGKSILLGILDKEEDRDEVLERRGERGRRWKMSVDEDLTREERKIKWRIRERAREPAEVMLGRGKKEGKGISGKREDLVLTEGKEEEEKKDEETRGMEERGKKRIVRGRRRV